MSLAGARLSQVRVVDVSLAPLGLIAVLFVSGCTCDASPPESGSSPSQGAAAATADATPEDLALPPRGREVVELGEAGVRLAAHDALDLAVLEQLAERAGFELDVRGVEPRRVSLRLSDVPLADAVGALLAPMPYAIDYRFDGRTGTHVIARVRVGAPGGLDASAPGGRELTRVAVARGADGAGDAPAPDAEESGGRRRLARSAYPGPRSGRSGSPVGRPAAGLDPEIAAALEDPDPAVRAEAVSDMETSGGGLRDVVALAEDDPSPEVRAAAVEALGFDGTHAAVEAVLGTLDDPDPQVLLAAIEVLEMTGDETVIGRMAPLAEHPSPAVREAAREALEFLE